jgi:hypothetical protein
MGDLAFNEKRFADCVPLYEHAAAGSDISRGRSRSTSFGWSHFNAERLDDAADAFRAVLRRVRFEARSENQRRHRG